jgi:Domain of unknown function (DUF2804), N-terminal/Domain of unknown function (DUF2804), C-terminal
MTSLRELTDPVDLCLPDGRLNPAALGWTRQPLHTANLRGRGRLKRWEYWAVMSEDAVFAVTVSDLDYAALHAVYFLDALGAETVHTALVPLARVGLPDRSRPAAVRVRAKELAIDLDHDDTGAWLSVTAPGMTAQFRVTRPPGHESLGVVVPWDEKRFQYTVKENTLPATGQVRAGDTVHDFAAGSWATLDHGRGRWPYRIRWNWGAGSGEVDGHVVGVQVGGAWTDGTGSTENAVCVDGRISYLPADLRWEYDPADWLAPWRITSPGSDRVDLTFTPFHVRTDRTSLGVLANDTHQAFGTWSGVMVDDAGTAIHCDGLRGWAEEVVNRW